MTTYSEPLMLKALLIMEQIVQKGDQEETEARTKITNEVQSGK